MSAKPAPRVRDKDGKQRALLDAATKVFAECGYDDAATKEIARRAGCSESLIFRYFHDKQGLFEQVVLDQIAEAVHAAEDKVALAYPDTFAEYIEQLFLARLEPTPGEDRVAGWGIAGRALYDPAFSLRVFLPNHRVRTAVIADGIRHFQRANEVSPDIDPQLLAELLANLISFTTSLGPRWFGTQPREIKAQIELAMTILPAGVRSVPSSKADGRRPRKARTARS